MIGIGLALDLYQGTIKHIRQSKVLADILVESSG